MQELMRVCAWCHPGAKSPGITHGICEEHAAELLREVHGIGTAHLPPPAKRSSNLTQPEVPPCTQ